MTYSIDDLVSAYHSLGLGTGDTVSLKTGLRSLGKMSCDEASPLDLHLQALDKVIDFEKGTVVVASTSTNLCNTDIPFSMEKTPGIMGALTERIRKHDDSLRSYHAYESYSVLGNHAADFCRGLSRHAYGVNTPEDRLVEMDAVCISIGLPSDVTCSIVHHLEMMAGVPYRYVREYHHPVEQEDGEIQTDVFYRHPWYRDSDIRKDYKAFFNKLAARGFVRDRVSVGAGQIEGYRLKEIYSLGIKLLNSDIYAVLSHEPEIKPWMA